MRPSQVRCPHGRPQAIDRVICQGNRFRFALKLHESKHRTEDFLLSYSHTIRNTREDSWLQVVTGRITDRRASNENLRSLLFSKMNVLRDCVPMGSADQWANVSRAIKWITHAQTRHSLGQPLSEFSGNAALHKKAAASCAALTSIYKHAFHSSLYSSFEIGVVEDNIRRFASEFQGDTLQRRAGLTHHIAPRLG